MECLKAAVSAGADAVYFAGKLFGARSYADNFSNDEIKEAVKYCHLRQVKVYVTVNTLVSDREIPEAMEYLKMLCNIGVDAVIVQDIGILSLIRENFKELAVHGSTQMTIHNTDGVLALENLGAEQVVLSRELSLNEIREIKENSEIKLEVFVHGALCMCYSGQCLMSSVLGKRSGNRGKCAQPCRLEYKINDFNQKGFYMSLKDLCAIKHIKELEKIGVSSLKIEGRMKGEEYVREVVGIYRKYMDSGEEIHPEDLERLNRIFFRGGQTDGYLTGKSGREMFCFNKPDNPYEKQSLDKNAFVEKSRKIALECKFKAKEGEYPEIEIWGMGIRTFAQGETVLQKGERCPLTEEFITEKLSKTGGTPYEFKDIEVEIDGKSFMAAREVNELRRSVLGKFEEKYLGGFLKNCDYTIREIPEEKRERAEFVCKVSSLSQFDIVKEFDFADFKVPAGLLIENHEKFAEYKDKIIIETPAIIKESKACRKITDSLFDLGFKKLAVNNMALVNCDKFQRFGDFRLNVYNSRSLEFFKNQGFYSVALSPEMNIGAIRDLKKSVKTEATVYGRLPLMVTENCIIRNREKCPCSRDVNYLTDRKGVKFPVIRDGGECRSVILNSTPTFMGDKINEVKESGVQRLMLYFTTETKEETEKICRIFFEENGTVEDFTRLHYYKGAL